MENNQISTRSGISSLTPMVEMAEAKKGKQLMNCSEEEIKEVLRYAMALLGVPANKVPQKEAGLQMVVFIKRRLWLYFRDELRLAFDYAVEKRTEVKLTLFDEPFSVKLIMEVWEAYEKYRKGLIAKQPKTDENTLNVYQRGEALTNILTPETKELIVSLAEKDKEKKVSQPKEKHKYHDMHQGWMRHFDKLKRDYGVPDSNDRMVYRYKKALNIDAFFNHKFKQFQKASIRKENEFWFKSKDLLTRLKEIEKI